MSCEQCDTLQQALHDVQQQLAQCQETLHELQAKLIDAQQIILMKDATIVSRDMQLARAVQEEFKLKLEIALLTADHETLSLGTNTLLSLHQQKQLENDTLSPKQSKENDL